MARVLISDADGCRSKWGNDAQFVCMVTLFAFGAGDGNRTRTVSLGRVLMPPCFPVLQRFWRPHIAPVAPYRPGLVARVWPGSFGSRAAETYARWPELFAWGNVGPGDRSRSDVTETGDG